MPKKQAVVAVKLFTVMYNNLKLFLRQDLFRQDFIIFILLSESDLCFIKKKSVYFVIRLYNLIHELFRFA